MDSTPPATTIFSQPDRILAAAIFTVSNPDAQNRLICIAGTSRSHPAYKAAVRAILAPCSITGVTQPSTTSSTRSLIIAQFFLPEVGMVPGFRVATHFLPLTAVLAYLLSLTLTMVGSLYSTWRTATVPPMEAIQ